MEQPAKRTAYSPYPANPDRIAVVYRAIAELKRDTRNPRTHRPRQIRQIARSIEAFGFNVPVLVDAQLKVIAGGEPIEEQNTMLERLTVDERLEFRRLLAKAHGDPPPDDCDESQDAAVPTPRSQGTSK